ncbi:Protein dml-1 [Grifola frondosa]|uniref:Protein dml-1 n=1 Tax=Grifola frondosa TaxID=5627 RepID=A0A1C7MDX3_GRIFR|nr:Protein dml-1 [Grifola frondosa]
MKEILYIQAGSLSNFVGTHFWNTQESYFTYEDGEEPIAHHDRSFREGITLKGESTYCPRLLLFDRKANFGALPEDLYGNQEGEEEQTLSSWGGDVVEYRQDRVPKSEYQSRLDRDEGGSDEQDDVQDKAEPFGTKPSDIHYWSDYSRVSFHPRTVQMLPDLADWESAGGDWNLSKQSFLQYNLDKALMEDSFRLFVEECDHLQGIQMMSDNTTFGGFTDSFLTIFRDEFPKVPSLTFSFLSSYIPGSIDVDDMQGLRAVINDALCLHSLHSLSTTNVSVQSPLSWSSGEWLDELDLNRNSLYHTSALLSTHIESCTLPLRLKNGEDDIASFARMLNWPGNMPFSHLSGMYPLSSTLRLEDFDRRVYDFSAIPSTVETEALDPLPIFSRINVSRGLSRSDIKVYDDWTATLNPLPHTVHAPLYPLPSSFPPFFKPSSPHYQASSERPLPSNRVFSELSTTSLTTQLFSRYARVVQDCMSLQTDVATRMGMEMDDLKELKDELWAVGDAYSGAEGEKIGRDEALGEDEE